ncbi:hypothetical protein NKH77_04175 [Streptomyces sp. M19]
MEAGRRALASAAMTAVTAVTAVVTVIAVPDPGEDRRAASRPAWDSTAWPPSTSRRRAADSSTAWRTPWGSSSPAPRRGCCWWRPTRTRTRTRRTWTVRRTPWLGGRGGAARGRGGRTGRGQRRGAGRWRERPGASGARDGVEQACAAGLSALAAAGWTGRGWTGGRWDTVTTASGGRWRSE